MREKRLRKQEMEEQARDSPEAESSQKHTDEGTLKRKVPAIVSLTSSGSSSPSSTTVALDSTLSTQKLPVGKPIPLRSKAASPLNSTPGARGAAVKAAPSVPVKQSSSPLETESDSQSPSRSREVPDKNTRNSTAPSPAMQNNNQKTSPDHTADTKGIAPLTVMHTHVSVCPTVDLDLFHRALFSSLRLCLLFSEAQAEREAVCGEACSAAEAGSEEEGSRAVCCRCCQTSEQHLHSTGGASVQRQTGRMARCIPYQSVWSMCQDLFKCI